MEVADVLRVTCLVTEVLDELQVPHLVVGSLASSLHGIPRATQDVDIVADLSFRQGDRLVAAMESGFYVDRATVHEAIEHQRSFNLIHLGSMLKVDVYVPGRDVYARSEMERCHRHQVGEDPVLELSVASAEDTVLHKLYWYKLGEMVSERQWRDALGVIKVQGKRLDVAYLRRWAVHLGVAELLEDALRLAGVTRLG